MQQGLSNIEKEFVLVHVHANTNPNKTFTTRNSFGKIPRVLELTYINKNLISSYEIAKNQKHPTPLDMPNAPYLEDMEFEIIA